MFTSKFSFALIVLVAITYTSAAPKKEKEVIVGGPSHINLDDPAVQEASQFAVSSISEGSGSPQKLGLFKVVSATRQVVSGALYTIKLQAAPTNCTKTAPPPPAVCAVNPNSDLNDDANFGEYTVKVWDQPWKTPRFQVTSVEPSEKTLKKKQSKKY